jgi:MarR family transcriptional repressor of emrRAB
MTQSYKVGSVARPRVSLTREGNLLGALVVAMGDGLRESTERAGRLGAAGPAALVALARFLEGRSVDDLARAVGLTPSGAVRLVDRLTAEGLVRRRPGPDGRTVALALTAKGTTVARRVAAARAGALEAALAGLSDRERATLGRLLAKLIESLTAARLEQRAQRAPPTGGWLCRLCDFAACGRPTGDCPGQSTAEALLGR